MVDELYQETILDHSKRPRNCHTMDDANHKADGYNPLCGDKLKLFIKTEGDIVKLIRWCEDECRASMRFRSDPFGIDNIYVALITPPVVMLIERAPEAATPGAHLADLTDPLPCGAVTLCNPPQDACLKFSLFSPHGVA